MGSPLLRAICDVVQGNILEATRIIFSYTKSKLSVFAKLDINLLQSRSASAVASVLLTTMEEMKVEQEKRDKLMMGSRNQDKKDEQKVKEQPTKEGKEKLSKEAKPGKRLITPEKPKTDKKQKASVAGNPPREALAALTNRFVFDFPFFISPTAPSPRKPVAPASLVAKTIAPPAKPSIDPPPSIR